MKNTFITLLSALTLFVSADIFAAEDHKQPHQHRESDRDKDHKGDDGREQHAKDNDHYEASTNPHKEDHEHSDRADKNASKKAQGDKK